MTKDEKIKQLEIQNALYADDELQNKWQGLSNDEINLIYPCTGGEHDFKDIARAIEAKLKEKNT